MAIDPVFVPTRVILETRLRVQKAQQPGAVGQIDNAIKKVRVGFYRSLPAALVTTLLAAASTDNPTTISQIDRALAESIEVEWVRKELLLTMPVLLADGAGGVDQEYNEDGLVRDASISDLDDILALLCASIQSGLEELAGDDLLNPAQVRATSIGPATAPPLPFSSLCPTTTESGTI